MVLKFSKEQLGNLEDRVADQWDSETAAELYYLYEPYFDKLEVKVDRVTVFCRTVREYAAAYQITERRDVFKLVVVALALGAHFCHDPRYRPMLEKTVLRHTVPSGRRLHLLCTDVDPLLHARKKAGGLAAFGKYLDRALRTQTVDTRDDEIPFLLEQLHRASEGSDVDLVTFVRFCLPHCNGYGLHSFKQRFVYCACALVHGVYWLDDPIMCVLREYLLRTSSSSQLTENLAAFYQRFG